MRASAEQCLTGTKTGPKPGPKGSLDVKAGERGSNEEGRCRGVKQRDEEGEGRRATGCRMASTTTPTRLAAVELLPHIPDSSGRLLSDLT